MKLVPSGLDIGTKNGFGFAHSGGTKGSMVGTLGNGKEVVVVMLGRFGYKCKRE